MTAAIEANLAFATTCCAVGRLDSSRREKSRASARLFRFEGFDVKQTADPSTAFSRWDRGGFSQDDNELFPNYLDS